LRDPLDFMIRIWSALKVSIIDLGPRSAMWTKDSRFAPTPNVQPG
jgi:hypothetical protein